MKLLLATCIALVVREQNQDKPDIVAIANSVIGTSITLALVPPETR